MWTQSCTVGWQRTIPFANIASCSIQLLSHFKEKNIITVGCIVECRHPIDTADALFFLLFFFILFHFFTEVLYPFLLRGNKCS